MSLLDSATAAFLLGVLFALLIGLFIVLAGTLRLLEFVFPSLSRWLDKHVSDDPEWTRPW